jgi:hypothetical protein
LPVRLQQHAVDVVDVDGLAGAADGLDQTANTQVAGLAEHAVGGADDQLDGGRREGVVAQTGAVEFAQDEVTQGVGVQTLGNDRVGDAALDVLVDGQVQRGQQAGPADQDQVVVLGEVLKQQAQLAQDCSFRRARPLATASSRRATPRRWPL